MKVGDEVKVGTKLFTYDRTSIENSLEQKNIDIEKKQIDLASEKKALEDDKRNLNTVKTAEERTELTISIAQQENSIKSDEFDIKQKLIERDKIENNLKNTDVYSEMEGIVRSIAVGSGSSSDSDTYITIMAEGDFRVKAKLNEQNVSEVAVGDKMLVYSRTNTEKVWTGTVTEMDTSSADTENQNSNYYYGGNTDSALSSTNYWMLLICRARMTRGMYGRNLPDIPWNRDLSHLENMIRFSTGMRSPRGFPWKIIFPIPWNI